MKKRIVCVICMLAMLLSVAAPVLATGRDTTSYDGKLIEKSDVPLRLHYDEEAPNGLVMKEDSSEARK